MLSKLVTTTALAMVLATGAYAQTTTPPAAPATAMPQAVPMVKKAEGFLAGMIIGEAVYNGTGEEAERIGDVNDLVLSPQGQIEAMVIGVGGFLGIGEKDVAIEYDLVQIQERDGDEVLVVETTADALKAQPEFERAAYQPMPADAPVMETKPATAEDLAKPPAEVVPTQALPPDQAPADAAPIGAVPPEQAGTSQ